MTSPSNGAQAPDSTRAEDLPAIHALFLIQFDLRKGYTITWKQAVPGVDLDGAVEFKSLPSGLHNVREDLVYFLHNTYAGLSAFINISADEASRNALMLAVGVLLPIGEGRMGKSWTYAKSLRGLSREVANDPNDLIKLESFWNQHRAATPTQEETQAQGGTTATVSPKERPFQGYKRNRGMSNAAATLGNRQSLSEYHPARSLLDFIRVFGPLVFPLYRAALLRKRILYVGEAPVHKACDYVYALSILTSVPQNALELLPSDLNPSLRLKPLFNVGIHDTPSLSVPSGDDGKSSFPASWVACTTDDVLSTKPQLFDVLVRLPPSYAKDAPVRIYPKLQLSNPMLAQSRQALPELKASQRDGRRFQNLDYNLRRPPFSTPSTSSAQDRTDAESDSSSSISSTYSASPVVEPISWPLAAYTSFMWWASAGEKRQRAEEQEQELQQDEDMLLQDFPHSASEESDHPQPSLELAIIAYFQRLTGIIMETLSRAVDREHARQQDQSNPSERRSSHSSASSYVAHLEDSDTSDQHPLLEQEDDADTGRHEDAEAVQIFAEDLKQMGLDPWSATDRSFVSDMLELWWGRKSNVNGGRVDCCGIHLL